VTRRAVPGLAVCHRPSDETTDLPPEPVRPAILSLLAVTAVAAAGCGAVGPVKSGDPAVGKALFIQNCGSCHTLADAKTMGTVGPNLDDAFMADKQQGFSLSTITDVVRGQIAYADSNPGQIDPQGGSTPGMPENIVQGQQAKDVAVYVAKCAGNPSCGVTPAKLPST
jgi:mono/diheme cytochrome c family protein